jgi:hypothetical protein
MNNKVRVLECGNEKKKTFYFQKKIYCVKMYLNLKNGELFFLPFITIIRNINKC